jgi:hypothetical protein
MSGQSGDNPQSNVDAARVVPSGGNSSVPVALLGGPNYRVEWSDHYNSAWAFEDCDAIAIREGTQNMFEHLVASKVSSVL